MFGTLRLRPVSRDELFGPLSRQLDRMLNDLFCQDFTDGVKSKANFPPLDAYTTNDSQLVVKTAVAGYAPDQLTVGVHALGYVAPTTEQAVEDFYPGYARAFSDIGQERGWRPITRADFEAQRTPTGALIVGSPEEAAEKVRMYDQALGGISRLTFQINAASIPHPKLMETIELIGTRVAPAVREVLV